MAQDDAHFTEPTTGYWQQLETEIDPARMRPPYRFGVPVRLGNGRWLTLPIRRRANDPEAAVASLIPNQASFEVVEALAAEMADLARPMAPEAVVGLPTLGLALAPSVARELGHPNYVPMGYSRKFWYRDELSEPVSSITSPDAGKKVFLDPNLVARIAGRRIIVVDDTISSGRTAVAALRLLSRLDTEIVGLVFAMSQGRQWDAALHAYGPGWADKVRHVFRSPLLRRIENGWLPAEPVSA